MQILTQALIQATNIFIHADYTSSVSGEDNGVVLGGFLGPEVILILLCGVIGFGLIWTSIWISYTIYQTKKKRREMKGTLTKRKRLKVVLVDH